MKTGKKRLAIGAMVSAAALACALSGLAIAESASQDEWAAYEPRVITTEDGRQIQQTPFANSSGFWDMGIHDEDWVYYNTYVLNADYRGCNSCHSLEMVLTACMQHPMQYTGQYPSGDVTCVSTSTCVTCHDMNVVGNFAHGHMSWASFQQMGGSCLSCHHVGPEGEFLLWDEVKYQVLAGITDVAAEDAGMAITYTQDGITPVEWMFTEQKGYEGYSNQYIAQSDNILEEYVISFTGSLGNPVELSIQELIDMFGTETRLQVAHCALEGAGENLIFQAEITGVPMDAVLDYLQLGDDVVVVSMYGVDGFVAAVTPEVLANGLLVYEMNGGPLPADQGYPVALWQDAGRSHGTDVRFLSEVYFGPDAPDAGDAALYGEDMSIIEFCDMNKDGIEGLNMPNMGVLTVANGQIFDAGEPVHIEGYAHGYTETITMIEFSLDSGQTWTQLPVENMDPNRWVYWSLDVQLEPGAYTLMMRPTSVNFRDGSDRVNDVIPEFMFIVQ